MRIGRAARLAFLDDLAAGRFVVESLDPGEYADAAALERQYADLDLGLAAARRPSCSPRLHTRRVLTFDERHFRAVHPLQGGAFELPPPH